MYIHLNTKLYYSLYLHMMHHAPLPLITKSNQIALIRPDHFAVLVKDLRIGGHTRDVLLVSNWANGILYYDAKSFKLLKTIKTSYTGKPSKNSCGQLRVFRDKIYMTAFDNDNLSSVVLRFSLETGRPLPAPGKTSAIFIGPIHDVLRGVGLFILE